MLLKLYLYSCILKEVIMSVYSFSSKQLITQINNNFENVKNFKTISSKP